MATKNKKITKAKKKVTKNKTKESLTEKDKRLLKPLEGAIPLNTNKTAFDIYLNAKNIFAALIGGKPNMDALVEEAQAGGTKGDRAFKNLVQIYTRIDCNGKSGAKGEGLLFPAIDPDMEFYSQGWVQERLKDGFNIKKNSYFKKDFWDAIFAWVIGKPAFRALTKELKRRLLVILHQDEWNKGLREKQITYADIGKVFENAGLLKQKHYEDPKAFKEYLKRYGVGGKWSGGNMKN